MPSWYAEKRDSGIYVAKPRARTGFSKRQQETVELSIPRPELEGEGSYAVSESYVYAGDDDPDTPRAASCAPGGDLDA